MHSLIMRTWSFLSIRDWEANARSNHECIWETPDIKKRRQSQFWYHKWWPKILPYHKTGSLHAKSHDLTFKREWHSIMVAHAIPKIHSKYAFCIRVTRSSNSRLYFKCSKILLINIFLDTLEWIIDSWGKSKNEFWN